MDEIDNYESSDAYTELERLVLRYAEDLTKKFETDDRVLAGLRRHLSERELVELNLTVGIAFLTNLFIKSFGIV